MLKNNIKKFREKKGWSYQDLANALECSQPQIAKLEEKTDNLNIGWINKCAAVFEVSPLDIIIDSQDVPRKINIALLAEAIKIVEERKITANVSEIDAAKIISIVYDKISTARDYTSDDLTTIVDTLISAFTIYEKNPS